MRCSLSATPLKDLKILSPGMYVEAVIFLTCCKSAFPIDLISFAVLQQSLFHMAAPGPPCSLGILSQETGDAPADHRCSSNSR